MSTLNTSSTVQSISADDAEKIIAEGTHSVIDVNKPQRYAAGHLPGAINVERDALTERLPSKLDTPLLFYCRDQGCQAAPRAAAQAAELGYVDVSVLPIGILGWEKEGRPTASGQIVDASSL